MGAVSFSCKSKGAFHSTKNYGNSGWGRRNRHFPEFHSEILGVSPEVGLKYLEIDFNMADIQASKHNISSI